MRWLQWSTYDLAKGAGGVEVHARCLQRELLKLGIDARLSSNPDDLDEESGQDWDVIQTHGSSPLPLARLPRTVRSWFGRPVLVHTLHGTTIGRMQACGEWLWPGGYAAYGREWQGVVQSQVVLGVHRELHLLGAARRLGKVTDACGNGWDSAREPVALSPELEARLTQAAPYFCFVGRGGDAVKNTSLIEEAMAGERLRKHLVAVPGDGFGERATKIGVLDSGQVLSVLRGSQGLLLPSHYEGMPLVALEALGHGVPVYASRVGGLATLDDSLQGLTFLEAEDARPWREALEAALGSPEHGERPRVERARVNRMHLKTWAQVADSAVAAVQKARKK